MNENMPQTLHVVKGCSPKEMKPTTADPIAIAKEWLTKFEHYIRQRDMCGARSLFHDKVDAFGLEADRVESLQDLQEREWKERWPFWRNFTFDMDKTRIVPANGLILVISQWIANSEIDQSRSHSGRASIVLLCFRTKVGCVHIHMSPGVGKIVA